MFTSFFRSGDQEPALEAAAAQDETELSRTQQFYPRASERDEHRVLE